MNAESKGGRDREKRKSNTYYNQVLRAFHTPEEFMIFPDSSSARIAANFFSSLIFVLFRFTDLEWMRGSFAEKVGIGVAPNVIFEVFMVRGAFPALNRTLLELV